MDIEPSNGGDGDEVSDLGTLKFKKRRGKKSGTKKKASKINTSALSFAGNSDDDEEDEGTGPSLLLKPRRKKDKSSSGKSASSSNQMEENEMDEEESSTSAALSRKLRGKKKKKRGGLNSDPTAGLTRRGGASGKEDTAAMSNPFAAQYASSSGSYNADTLRELKANAIHVGGMGHKGIQEGGTGDQETVVLSGEEAMMQVEKMNRNGASSSSSSSNIRIYDDEAVAAARRRREKMRERGSAEDYIPIDGEKKNKNVVEIQGRMYALDNSDTSGAVVREDESDLTISEYDDYQGSRIAFHDPGKARRKPDRMEIEEPLDEEEDEEMKEWERQQASKGGAHTRVGVASGQETQNRVHDEAVKGALAMLKSTSDPLGHVGVDRMMKTLRFALVEARESKERSCNALNQSKSELASLQAKFETLGADLSRLSDEYVFYQSVRDQVLDVLGCLNQKVSSIERSLDQLHGLWKEDQEDKDETEVTHNEEDRDLAFQIDRLGSGPPQLDEFGRDVNLSKKQALERRRKVREKWREERRAADGHLEDPNEDEGWCSDGIASDSPVRESMKKRMEGLLEEASHIFDDTLFEFTNFDESQKLFQLWKDKYPDTYRDAYISLSVASLFTPYVKLELLRWNPFSHPRLESMVWYQKLLAYGISDATPADDDDFKLIPRLVSKAVAPHLISFISNVWSPHSLSMSVPLSVAVRDILDHMSGLDKNANASEAVCDAVLTRFQQQSKYVGQLLSQVSSFFSSPSSISSDQISFLSKQCWRSVKVLSCAKCFIGCLEPEPLWSFFSEFVGSNIVPSLSLLSSSPLIPTDRKVALFIRLFEACDPGWTSHCVRSFIPASSGFFSLLTCVQQFLSSVPEDAGVLQLKSCVAALTG